MGCLSSIPQYQLPDCPSNLPLENLQASVSPQINVTQMMWNKGSTLEIRPHATVGEASELEVQKGIAGGSEKITHRDSKKLEEKPVEGCWLYIWGLELLWVSRVSRLNSRT